MIYITGDTHIPTDIHKLSSKSFPEQKQLTKDDFVIICGDFGGVWNGSREEQYWIKWLKSKSFTTLFADGNHENFDMLSQLPQTAFCGGCVHRVSDGIYHLMRGEIYTIDSKRIFTFGGAESHDRKSRTEHKNWWNDELPDEKEILHANKRLEQAGWNVDYVITHCAPASIQQKIAPSYAENELTAFLETVKSRLTYQRWYFGHYHLDREFDRLHTCVFQKVIPLI